MPDLVAHLFVYGTLRRGDLSNMAAWLANHAQWVSAARARGQLYLLEGYPGFVTDPAGKWIVGDLFAIPPGDVGQAVLAKLDGYEECSPRFPEPKEYKRVVLDVCTESGTMPAWCYIYNWPVAGRSKVIGGDFLRGSP